jgi:peroxiredoxin
VKTINRSLYIQRLILTFFALSFFSNSTYALKVGDKAPDFTLNDINGKAVSLSSLKGKVVLIDFWASWCGYCKIANAEFIPIYDKYKGEGFEIMSISLDNKKEAWANAIKSQKLPWPYHVSDLKGWEGSQVAALYSVEVLPTTFLIDEHGVIIEKDLDEYDLEKKLKWLYFEQIHFYPHIATTKLFFTGKAKFQIEDGHGKILLKGKDLEVDISSLAEGEYVIKYEEKTEKFVKKNNTHAPVTFFPERVDDKITLSLEASYEIYNQRGKRIRHGRDSHIDVHDLHAGVYYLSIEGNIHTFYKK